MTKALWSYGFRPFFFAAGLAATVLIPWWAGTFVWGVPSASGWPPMLWHGHEMLFGFMVAAIAGFLLTAVPSWTGARGFAGRPLVLLAALWLLGRIAVGTSALWPRQAVAGIDLLFLPALGALVLPPLAGCFCACMRRFCGVRVRMGRRGEPARAGVPLANLARFGQR